MLEGEHVDVGWFHEFFLDAGRGDVDEVTITVLVVSVCMMGRHE